MRARGVFVIMASAVLAPLGCGSKTTDLPEPVPVTGTVTLDNKPLANATVYFTPTSGEKGVGATATTDANGKYELSTRYGGDVRKGAVPGKYRVHFSLMVDSGGKPIPADSETPPADLGARESLPTHLSDQNETRQTADVSANGGTIDFKLSRKRGGGGLMPR